MMSYWPLCAMLLSLLILADVIGIAAPCVAFNGATPGTRLIIVSDGNNPVMESIAKQSQASAIKLRNDNRNSR